MKQTTKELLKANTLLTKKQQLIFEYLKECIAQGFPPTRKDIAERFGFASPNAAECHLQVLAGKGCIEIIRGTARGIRIINPTYGLLSKGGK